MGFLQNCATIALVAGMYISNPDEESFHRYIEKQMKREGSHWIERKVAAFISTNNCKRDVHPTLDP